MVGAKVYGVVSTIAGTVTIGAAVTPPTGVEPTFVPFVGPVPIFAVAIGVLTALLVRWVTMSSDRTKLWSYNLAVTLLAMIGAATFIIDHQVGPGNSFWVGGSFGATGAGLVGVMRSKIFMAIVEGVRAGFIRGVSTPPSPADTDEKKG